MNGYNFCKSGIQTPEDRAIFEDNSQTIYGPDISEIVLDYHTDTVWNDSYYGPQTIPCAHNIGAFGYLQTNPDGTAVSFNPDGPYQQTTDVVKVNVYWEICNNSINNASCSLTTTTATNTAVEFASFSYFYLVDGVWYTLADAWRVNQASFQYQPPAGDAEYKYCTDPTVMAFIDDGRYDPDMIPDVNGVRCFRPSGGAFPHPWTGSMWFPDGFDFEANVDAISSQLVARLVQIDDALPNDFENADFCTYAGTDTRDIDHNNIHSMSVQGHFRAIPKTGQWGLFGVVRGIATKAEFDANPPPLTRIPT